MPLSLEVWAAERDKSDKGTRVWTVSCHASELLPYGPHQMFLVPPAQQERLPQGYLAHFDQGGASGPREGRGLPPRAPRSCAVRGKRPSVNGGRRAQCLTTCRGIAKSRNRSRCLHHDWLAHLDASEAIFEAFGGPGEHLITGVVPPEREQLQPIEEGEFGLRLGHRDLSEGSRA